MKLPNAEQASVVEAKIRYLLSEEKSGGKDRFFKRFGFSVVQWELLKDALLQHAQSHEVHQIIHTDYGVKYTIRGELTTPDGRQPHVQSVWQIDHEQRAPYLVTAYPA